MHINAARNRTFFDLKLNVGLIFSKPDHIPVFRPSVGLGSAAHINCLQDIGLSLCIVAIENIGSLTQFHMQFFIIAVILKFYGFDGHRNSLSRIYLIILMVWPS